MGKTVLKMKTTARILRDRGNAGAPPSTKNIILFILDKDEMSLADIIGCLKQSGHVGGHAGGSYRIVRAALDSLVADRTVSCRVSRIKGVGTLWRKA